MRLTNPVTFGLFLSFLFAANSQAQVNENIDMHVGADNRMTVDLTLNDENVPAVIDTAATIILMDGTVLDEQTSEPLNREIEILGIDGTEQFQISLVGPLKLGSTHIGKQRAAINTQPRLAAHRSVIPLNALPAKNIDFNFDDGKLSFHNQRLNQPAELIVESLKYEELNGLILIPIKINGKRGRAIIDTGSEVSFINSAYVKKSGAKLNLDKTLEFFGTAGDGVDGRIVRAKRFALGPHKMDWFDVYMSDPPLLDHLGLDDEPIMLIGIDFLKRFRLQIDRSQNRVLFGHRATGTAAP